MIDVAVVLDVRSALRSAFRLLIASDAVIEAMRVDFELNEDIS